MQCMFSVAYGGCYVAYFYFYVLLQLLEHKLLRERERINTTSHDKGNAANNFPVHIDDHSISMPPVATTPLALLLWLPPTLGLSQPPPPAFALGLVPEGPPPLWVRLYSPL